MNGIFADPPVVCSAYCLGIPSQLRRSHVKYLAKDSPEATETRKVQPGSQRTLRVGRRDNKKEKRRRTRTPKSLWILPRAPFIGVDGAN